MLLFLHLALSAIGLVCVPATVLGQAVIKLQSRDLLALALLAAAYGAWLLWFMSRRNRAGSTEIWRVLVAGCVAVVPVLLAIMVVHAEFSRPALFVSLSLALGLMLAASRLNTLSQVFLAAALAVLGITLQLLLARGIIGGSSTPPAYSETHLGSALYELSVESYRRSFPTAEARQGGISRFGDRYVRVDGDGNLSLFRRAPGERALEVSRLPRKVPLNRDAFKAAGGPTRAGQQTNFRVADVLTQETATGYRLFVTYHFWNVDQRCWVMRVSSLEGPEQDFLTASDTMQWTTVYETQPCIPLSQDGEPVLFSGINNGGRMALMDQNHLLVSIGDHQMEGYSTSTMASQDPVSSYGKTILIDLRQQTAEIFSMGHRNPQGLLITSGGVIWETEHGPQGGDELNLVHRGGNFGWPLVSYGTEYGTHAWPLSATPGTHEQFEQPFFSWVPSIGVSNLIEVRESLFDYWNGDLLASSLRDRAFWRLRTRENRVVMAERIELGERIRDLEIGHDGELVVMADGGSIHFIVPSEGAETGEGLYRTCAGCHVAPKGSVSALGPNLSGIIGRKVASESDFVYSEGMRKAGGTWTPERLDAFMANPAAAVPGTTMLFNGIRDPAARKKLIEYMASPQSRLDKVPEFREF